MEGKRKDLYGRDVHTEDGVRDCVGSSVPALVGAFNCSRALAAAARAARRGGGTPLKSSNSIKNYREFLKMKETNLVRTRQRTPSKI